MSNLQDTGIFLPPWMAPRPVTHPRLYRLPIHHLPLETRSPATQVQRAVSMDGHGHQSEQGLFLGCGWRMETLTSLHSTELHCCKIQPGRGLGFNPQGLHVCLRLLHFTSSINLISPPTSRNRGNTTCPLLSKSSRCSSYLSAR